MAKIELPVRVYYEDTDAGGVVYYAKYLGFMERARAEWLRERGIEQDVLVKRDNIIFAVTRVEVDYRRPARFDELLVVTAEIAERRKVGFTFYQEVRRKDDDELLCSGKVWAVCLDATRLRPRPLPESVLTEIDNGL